MRRTLTWLDPAPPVPLPALPPLNERGYVCCPYCDWRKQASRRVLGRYRAHYRTRHRT